MGCKGVFITRTCYPDVMIWVFHPEKTQISLSIHLVNDVGAFKILKITKYSQKPSFILECIVRKPAFCMCENKGADQLYDNRTADHRLCFRYINSTIPLLPKSEILSLYPLLLLYRPVCVGLGRKPRRQVSCDVAHLYVGNL